MKSIQLILAVLVIAAVCGSDSNDYYETKPDYYKTKPDYHDTKPECYKKEGYCEHYSCRKGYVCDLNNSYGCPRDGKCCLPDESYTPYGKSYGNNMDDYYNIYNKGKDPESY